MTDCPLQLINGCWTCPDCNWEYKRKGVPVQSEKPPRRNCPKSPSRGLGDTIAKMTKAVGIKPCGGCKKRQKKLNKWVPYASHEQPVDHPPNQDPGTGEHAEGEAVAD